MSEQETTVLVVEDEMAIRNLLRLALQSAGFQVVEVANAEAAWQTLRTSSDESSTIDCMLLDWMLPGMDGLALLKRIRQHDKFRRLPVMMLTAKGAEQDQVEGFEVGADDYVVKPFSPKALVARLKALLRRTQKMAMQAPMQEELQFGDLKLDFDSHRFWVGDQELHLGPTEFRLVSFFLENPDKVFSRHQLLDQVWGESVVVEERTVDVHIRRLRKQLEPLKAADYIQTVRGTGYRLSQPQKTV